MHAFGMADKKIEGWSILRIYNPVAICDRSKNNRKPLLLLVGLSDYSEI